MERNNAPLANRDILGFDSSFIRVNSIGCAQNIFSYRMPKTCPSNNTSFIGREYVQGFNKWESMLGYRS